MTTYAPRAYTVEAVRWDGTREHAFALCREHGWDANYVERIEPPPGVPAERRAFSARIEVATAAGPATLEPGWWLVRHPSAGLLVLPPHTFAALFAAPA